MLIIFSWLKWNNGRNRKVNLLSSWTLDSGNKMSDQIYFDWIEFLNWKENCQPGSICFGATSIKGIQRRRKNNWRKLKIVYDLNYSFWEKFEKTGVEKTSSFHFPATNEIINQLIELTSSLVCLQLVLAKWCFSLTFYFSFISISDCI